MVLVIERPGAVATSWTVCLPVIAARRKPLMGIVIVVEGDADLHEVVGAPHAVGRLADLLHCWKKQADEHGDDCQYDKQFDQRKARSKRGQGRGGRGQGSRPSR